jgi:biotin synthase
MTVTDAVPSSPQHLRLSLAAAMTLGYAPGRFYRDARLHCINLLLTYPEGCRARCAYCGLSAGRSGTAHAGRSFIRVPWPAFPLADIVSRIAARQADLRRVCISMVTRRRAVADTITVCRRLREAVDVPVSILITPTLLRAGDLEGLKAAGADKVGVAVDLATPELFDRYRGSGVAGPHRWEVYWECYGRALEVFGRGQAGVHLIVGMGETEREMCAAIQRSRGMGGGTHLFSFFPEPGSPMEGHPRPAMSRYRRIQLARYLIDGDIARADAFAFGPDGRITDYGIPPAELDAIVGSGEPFRTSGCTGADGEVACNRPFANSRPGPHLRNYPFPPAPADLRRIRLQLRAHLDL